MSDNTTFKIYTDIEKKKIQYIVYIEITMVL